MQGQVKFFKMEKGFGFIVSEEAGNDVFFHISQCEEGYQPQEGDVVTFELGQGRDGRTAAKEIRFVSQGTIEEETETMETTDADTAE
ncbi:MAG: cold shock domain-containing protein [bacterium]|nr:cold shock domain-containing protein [bacterium]